eukprot:358495-Chlamydomonas_euryale.AAC.5
MDQKVTRLAQPNPDLVRRAGVGITLTWPRSTSLRRCRARWAGCRKSSSSCTSCEARGTNNAPPKNGNVLKRAAV